MHHVFWQPAAQADCLFYRLCAQGRTPAKALPPPRRPDSTNFRKHEYPFGHSCRLDLHLNWPHESGPPRRCENGITRGQTPESPGEGTGAGKKAGEIPKKIKKKPKKTEILLDTFPVRVYILSHRRRWRPQTEACGLFDSFREGKKTNKVDMSAWKKKKTGGGSSASLKINSWKMDWGRELCEESSAFGPENKSWRVWSWLRTNAGGAS